MAKAILEENKSSGIDVKRLLLKIVRNYPWFLVSVGLFLGGAYLYLRYTVPLYLVTTFVQIQPPRDATNMLGGTPFAQKTGTSNTPTLDMNGEIFKLRSAALVGEVVDSLHLDVQVTEGKTPRKKILQAKQLPFSISVHKENPDDNLPEYTLQLRDSSFYLNSSSGFVSGYYDDPLILNGDTLTVHLKEFLLPGQRKSYQVSSAGRSAVVGRYLSRLTVGNVPKGGAGMLQLSLRDEIPDRAKDFIEVLIYRYDLANLIYRNKSLRSEMDFLDNRLATVNAELERQENNVRDFKASNKINDVSSSANQLLTSLSTIDTKKSENDYKENLLNLVEKNINSNSGKEDRINVTGLQDADLIGLVAKYNGLVSQRNNILSQSTPNDLRLEPLAAQLGDTKSGILNRIRSIRSEIKTSNEFLKGQEKNTTGRFKSLPEKEKDYIQVNRLLNVKQSLYVFLLQRKEDMNIEYASSGMDNTRIVDWRVNNNVQDPKPMMVYLAAFAVGLMLPAGFITTRLLLNKRIVTSREIYTATNLSIAGEILFDKKNRNKLLQMDENVTAVAEQFRTLRTNISYFNKGTYRKVLLVTSGISGEGKSFVSLNLANSIAISNKKVVLLEFDLRNPTLSDMIGAGEKAGITNFLEGKANLEDLIRPVDDYPNLSFIGAGYPLTPHPGEIILNHRMQQLFDYLRRSFDYIILDTPPIESVSDALTLARWADSSLFVIRHKYSFRSSLTLINQLFEDKKLPNPALVINGIIPGDGFNNIYGYGYGYANGRGRKKRPGNKLKIA